MLINGNIVIECELKTAKKLQTNFLSNLITNVLIAYTNVLANVLTMTACMVSIHSPYDIFMVLVSIFLSKTFVKTCCWYSIHVIPCFSITQTAIDYREPDISTSVQQPHRGT